MHWKLQLSLLACSWHPSTQMKVCRAFPLTLSPPAADLHLSSFQFEMTAANHHIIYRVCPTAVNFLKAIFGLLLLLS